MAPGANVNSWRNEGGKRSTIVIDQGVAEVAPGVEEDNGIVKCYFRIHTKNTGGIDTSEHQCDKEDCSVNCSQQSLFWYMHNSMFVLCGCSRFVTGLYRLLGGVVDGCV